LYTYIEMNRFSRGASYILVWWLLAGPASRARGQQYAFLPVAGSPKSVMHNLFQDSSGRLWLGGAEPACFDGVRFFVLRDYGFPAGEAYDFSEDSSGAIWIGSETGVYRFAKGRVEEVGKGFAVNVIPAAPDVAVAAMGPLGRGIPANTSLVRFQRTGETWEAETVMGLDSPGPLTLDPSGMLLYPVPFKGWSEMRLDDVVRWRPGGQVPVIPHSVAGMLGTVQIKIMRDHTGCVWVGASGSTRYDCGDGFHFAPFQGATTRSNLHEGSDKKMVVWGDSLLASGRPGSFWRRNARQRATGPGGCYPGQGWHCLARHNAGIVPVLLSVSHRVLDSPRRPRQCSLVNRA
jgi:hypothetical protein